MQTNRVAFEGLLVESAVYIIPAPPPGTSGTLNVTGWLWWLLISADFGVDNSGGLAAAIPVIGLANANNAIVNYTGSQIVAVGAAFQCFYAFGVVPAVTSLFQGNCTLGNVPILGDGQILLSFLEGDAGTQISAGVVTLIGERYRNVSGG